MRILICLVPICKLNCHTFPHTHTRTHTDTHTHTRTRTHSSRDCDVFTCFRFLLLNYHREVWKTRQRERDKNGVFYIHLLYRRHPQLEWFLSFHLYFLTSFCLDMILGLLHLAFDQKYFWIERIKRKKIDFSNLFPEEVQVITFFVVPIELCSTSYRRHFKGSLQKQERTLISYFANRFGNVVH